MLLYNNLPIAVAAILVRARCHDAPFSFAKKLKRSRVRDRSTTAKADQEGMYEQSSTAQSSWEASGAARKGSPLRLSSDGGEGVGGRDRARVSATCRTPRDPELIFQAGLHEQHLPSERGGNLLPFFQKARRERRTSASASGNCLP